MTLLSGTLADLDLASIAQVTSLGRTSLRLELRATSGHLIGSLVLKAGRVVSATAGGAHGHDALRVIMNAASDTRFQLAREPLDFALSSSLASVADLGPLKRAAMGSTRRPATSNGAGRPPRAATRPGPTPQAAVRIEMMQGRLDEFDLLTLLQTVGVSRQLVEIEVRDHAATPVGSVSVKAGKIVSARAGDTAGIDAISRLISSPGSFQFAAFRVAAEIGQVQPLASVAEVSIRLAPATEQPSRVVMEGALSEFDIPTLLQTVGTSRQHCALEVHDERMTRGTIFLKSGIVVSAQAGQLTGIPAIQSLMSSHWRDQFRLIQLADPVPGHAPIGPVSHVLLELEAPEPTVQQPARAPTGAPGAAPSQVDLVAASAPALVMEGKLSDFDVRTLLETLGATRQHVRLQVFDSGQAQLGEVALKAGWILSSQVGALVGTDALVVLLGVSQQLRFRVLTGFPDPAGRALQPLGAIHELLGRLALDRAPPRPPTTRILRWAIPVSFVVGGVIVFVVLRGWSTHPVHDAPVVAMKTQPAETTAPLQPSAAAAATAAVAPPPTPPSPTGTGTAPAPPGESAAPPATRSPPPTEARPAPAPPGESAAPATPTTGPPAPPARSIESPAPPQPGELTAPAPPTPRQPPRISASIKTAQAALRRLGFDPGPSDNVYGRLTRNAVIQFQRSQHLPVTGALDQETWSAIVTQLSQ